MRKISVSGAASVMALLLPALASAQTLTDTLFTLSTFLNAAIGLFVTLAIVIFFWGLIKYLMSVGEQKAEGLQIMFYGVVAIFVMVSIWGIIRLLQNTFRVQNNSALVPGGIRFDPSGTPIR